MANFCCPIETEPKTLSQVDLNHAREVAVSVVKDNKPSEASRILSEGMRPVMGIEEMGKVIERNNSIHKLQETSVAIEAVCQCSVISVVSSPEQCYSERRVSIKMSATTMKRRTPKSTNKQSLFFNDLATPVTNRRSGSGKFTTPGQAAAVSALWRENFSNSDLPPPPVFTLEDRSDFSPESGKQDYPVHSPDPNSNPRSPTRTPTRTPNNKMFSTSPGSNASTANLFGNQGNSVQSPAGNLSWWSGGEKGKETGSGSPVDGVVHRTPATLYTLPPPREVARPEIKRNAVPVGSGSVDEEEWVTVYGFSPADTNLVLREFERCGVILKHVPGPRDSNWMHILYQSRFDAQKALSKNGMQLNGALIIGVKPVDPMLRQSLTDRLHNQGFTPIPPPTTSSSRKSDTIAFNASPRPFQPNGPTTGTMATPAKSYTSKIMDLMFGL